MLFFLVLIQDEGDAAFLGRFYQEHYRLMYYQALRVLRSPEDAEDAVSGAILKLIKKIELLKSLPCNKQEAYMVITVRNTAINLYNKRKARVERTEEMPLETVADSQGQGPEARLMEAAGVARVKEAVQQLPPREKDALMMRYFQRYSDQEIAEALQVQPVSVRALISRGRKRLQRILQEGRA